MRALSCQFRSAIFRTALAALFLLITQVSVPDKANAQPPDPVVAIHVSELTQALETAPAVSPTPTGSGTTGKQWWYTSWHYFVAYESLKEALRSDGTPFVAVSDSDIAAGKLRNADGSPRYPILISLAAEAIADNEITPLRDFVNAGGFLFVGSTAFTRNTDGTTRGDFALASEMGVHMAASSLQNQYLNAHFTKRTDHRLVSHIPSGTLLWSAPTNDDQTPWVIYPDFVVHRPHYAWKVIASGATTLADGDDGPLLSVKNYGQGQIVYHGVFQPLIGHGGYDPGMYAYLIYRRAIEWAFESFSLPIVRVSPWPYQYDAAMMARHDFENDQTSIRAIESSAQFEKNLGVKGEYYFSTGALREDMGGNTAVVASLRNAVSSYGATIGSHNGGLKNPSNTSLLPSAYEYWHWGPDEALDTTPSGYTNGKAYASASILASFQDIEGWLSGTDNGRAGCSLLKNCPRTWVSPFFNSAREGSREILEQLGAVVSMGEQKISPFPHQTLSYKTRGKYFSMITLPASDWYVGTDIAQSTEYGHTSASLTEAVDFYYNLGALINIYGHAPSNNGSLQQQYVEYGVSKPRLWFNNSVGINDWWRVRAAVALTPTSTATGNTYTVSSSVAGATDSTTAIEITLPKNPSHPIANMSVSLNGTSAGPSNYRTTDYGIKVLVGSTVSNVNVQYSLQTVNQAPVAVDDTYGTTANTTLNQTVQGVLNNDSDPEGTALTARLVSGTSHGSITLNIDGSFVYTPIANYVGSDSFTYMANDGTANSNVATVILTVTSTSNVLFSEDFTRAPATPAPLSPWVKALGTWTVTSGVLQGSGASSSYSYAYVATSPLWSNYTLEGRVKFSAGGFGGGLGGRVNPATGAHYGAWIYPSGSIGGSNVLKLTKFRGWTTWSGTPMMQVSLPSVGTDWHTLKMVFNGNRIQVYYDETLMVDVTDNNFDSRAAYLSGGICGGMWTYTSAYSMQIDNIVVRTLAGTVPLVAVNDSYSTKSNTALNQLVPGVLANDTAPEGATLAQLVSGPSHGTLTLNTNGSFLYTPVTNYVGSDSFTYTANDGTNSSNTATVTITVLPALASINVTPASVTGGSTAQGTVVLNGPAADGGAAVQLASDNTSAANVPASVTVPAGSTSATFTITATAVATSTPVVISASYGGVTNSATLTVSPPVLTSFLLTPASVTGGSTAQGTVALNGPAPNGGTVVQLASDNTSAANVPASVTVPAGSTSAIFTITATAVAISTPVVISVSYGGVTKSATLTVTPPVLSTLSISPTSVTGGATSQGTVTLSGPAQSGGVIVPLSSDSSAASVPASVSVPDGSTSATFTITTSTVTSTTAVTISAAYGGATKTATLTVTAVAPTFDTTVSADSGGVLAGSTIKTPTFTTKARNELLLAFISASYTGAAPNITVSSVSGGSLTWKLVRRTNTQQGSSEIWQAFASARLTNASVTARLSKSGAAASITVVSFPGVNVTPAVGAIGGASGSTGAPTASLTTQGTNSWVFGVGNDWDGEVARTVGGNQTMVHEHLSPTGDTFWVQRQNTAVQPAGTVVTINDIEPTNHQWNLSIVEILQ